MRRALTRLASLVLLVLMLGVLGGPGLASAAQPLPIPPPIPSPIPDPIGGDLGVFPTCMVSPVDCFISGLVAELASNAAEFIQNIINQVASQATFDPTSEGFRHQYAVGFAVAVFVLCVLLMRLFYRMSRHADRMPQYRESLLHYLPLGLALCAVGPGLGALLADMSNGLTDGIIAATSSPGEMLDSIEGTITGLQNSTTPIISILLLLALILAATMVIVTLLLQSLALYLTGSVMAIAFVMMIDPELRQKAARMPMAWLGILLAKPLLFFMMGTVVQLVSSGAFASDPIVGALMAILALLMVSLAPLTLRKYAPIIPGGGDATASGASGAMVGGAADMGGAVSQQQMAKAQMEAVAGRGGGGGSGASSSQVRIGTDRATSAGGPTGSSLMPTAAPTASGGQMTNGLLQNYLSMSGPGGGLGTAATATKAGAGAGAGGAAAGGAAAGGAAAIAGPLGLAAVGVKATKDFVESAAPNIGGSE